MKTNDFDYKLDEDLIAQHPLKERTDSRMMVLDRDNGDIVHSKFSSVIDYLEKGDVLVLNDTKVLPARLIGLKELTKAKIELMLLKQINNDLWQCLVKPLRRVKIGTKINFTDRLSAFVRKIIGEGIIEVEFKYTGLFLEVLDELGEMPLPPYITEKLSDNNRYQTVYAENIGSVAAPTAGLHFTPELLDRIETKGIKVVYLTLHVGLGTFRPVTVEEVTKHKMHSEYYEISAETANVINNAKRVISVGTTSTRTLESIYRKERKLCESSGWTDIFIYPGFDFKVIDGLITNFHLPKSTLIMLVSAFSSKENILNAYEEAVKEKYRFFSFGDSMFIR